MNMRRLLLLIAGLLVSCGSADGTTMSMDGSGEKDLGGWISDVADVDPSLDGEAAPDDLVPEVESDTETWDFVLPETLDSETWGSVPGEPGSPCESASDCNEGFCIQTTDGMQCTTECVEDCPFGWDCVLHAASLPDEVYICAPPLVSLCRPCQVNTDCMVNGVDTGEACISYGPAGNFCGGKCETDESCPDGYECLEAEDTSGGSLISCVLAEGECECRKWFVDDGAATECYAENEWGSCPGERICLADGLSPCNALMPAEEICDGLDNDCDVLIDEEQSESPCNIINQFGTCPGVESCKLGALVCEGQQAKAELCDGEDNDCDGLTDEGFEDTDGDGVADCLENDKDGDGIVDGLDNCPSLFNPGQADYELDTVGDACDPDDDNDQTADEEDCAPKDAGVYPGAEELCDGKDNDCNYVVDEGYPDTDADGWKDCLDDDDDNDGTADGLDCGPTDPALHPAAPEVCDGKDNDCDNEIDEGLGTLSCGKGECFHELPACLDGLEQWCDPLAAAAIETCDGLDNDCDGLVDEELGSTTCGLGPCFHTVPNCLDGQEQECDPLAVAGDEVCDGVDNDCDGKIDEEMAVLACGVGICFHTTPSCIGGVAYECDPMAGAKPEVCDGVDNDCDGKADEEMGDSACGKGECVHSQPICEDGVLKICDPYEGAAPEVCDGKDNDCDGLVDDDLGKSTCGLGVCTHTVLNCLNGVVQECDPQAGTGDEVCDGLDNDCDGKLDEELGSLTCGKGICFHAVQTCVGGVEQQCNPFAGAQPESCDGVDNDCDGDKDEDLGTVTCGKGQCQHDQDYCVAGKITVCDPFDGAALESCDGVDNDCDGLVDEEMGTVNCGVGACYHGVAACLNGAPQVCDPLEGAGEEVCDGEDNDCDGISDPEDATDCIVYYLDGDNDGYGVDGSSRCLCSPDAPYSALAAGDCDDESILINPGVDEDCDTLADEDCSDAVNDGCIYATCFDLYQNIPGLPSGEYQIDVDGGGPKPPITVDCDMVDDGGGWTILHHDSEVKTQVVGFEEPGSYVKNVTYAASDQALDDVIALSNGCKQHVLYECKGSLFHNSSGWYAWWLNTDGDVQYGWPSTANCDINDDVWRQDGGWITDAGALPVGTLHFGDTGGGNEQGYHTLGPLWCR